MQREQAPTWVGPMTALILVLILAFIGIVLWLTVFAGDGEESHEEPAAFQMQHTIALRA
ncbi:MAG: hypothetical protein AB7R89_19575 [Dehalococcoidia bacterium]